MPQPLLYIEASAFNAAAGEFATVSCTAEDDGSFNFPTETKAEMGMNFQSALFSAGRTSYRVEQKGDAVLLLSVRSE